MTLDRDRDRDHASDHDSDPGPDHHSDPGPGRDSDHGHVRTGFLGLGLMGEPMALNVARSGAPLTVWNRTPSRCEPLRAAGAEVAGSPAEVFERSTTVLLMLADEDATDHVLGRRGPRFAVDVRDRTVVHLGTNSPGWSERLDRDITRAGGRYVESPVSGSRGPAQAGELVAMPAGDREAVSSVRPLLRSMCRQTVYCGPVPNGLLMKFSINVFLVSLVTGLAEAAHFAARHGLRMEDFAEVHDSGPMASAVSRTKLHKIVTGDHSPQAAAHDVLKNTRLITEAARSAGVPTPLLDSCHALFGGLVAAGERDADMSAVFKALGTLSRPGGGTTEGI